MRQLSLPLRRLVRSPAYALTCAATLALGIAATVTTFSVVQAVLLEPLPFEDAEQLVSLRHRAPGITQGPAGLSQPMYFTYVDNNRSFEEVGLYRARQAVVTGLDRPEQVPALELSQSLLSVLQLEPVAGRLFTPDEDRPGAADTVVLGHGYWQRRLGGSEEALARTLRIDGRPHRVVGVLPPGFELPNLQAQLFFPARLDPANPDLAEFTYSSVARLAAGVSLAAANADVDRMLPMSVERFGWSSLEALENMQYGADLELLRDTYVGNVEGVLWILFGTAGLVLLIACSNVANLFLVRAEGRQQEVALRSSLGSSRLRLAGLFLSESTALALVGGALGTALGLSGLMVLVNSIAAGGGAAFFPRLTEIGPNPKVLLFALVISLVTGLIVGLIPILRMRKFDLVSSLKEGGRGAVGDQRHLSRRFLVILQIAMTFVLLVASGLMIRSFRALQAVDPGFDAQAELMTFRVTVPENEVPSSEEVALLFQRTQRAFENLPGVASVGAAQWAPMGFGGSGEVFWLEGDDIDFSRIPPVRRVKAVTPGYFRSLATPLVSGRTFRWDDLDARRTVVVISENLAREWWQEPAGAIGKRITIGHPTAGLVWREVIGVVADINEDGPSLEQPTMVYWPMAGLHQNRSVEGLTVPRSMVFQLRAQGREASGLVPEARRALGEINANLPISEENSLEELVGRAVGPTSFTLMMLFLAAAVALFLGMIGVYAVLSYIVAQRKREIGVRMAFGASARNILLMVGRQGAVLGLLGLVVGFLVALAATRLLAALLFGVQPADPLTFSMVALLLLVMVLVACFFPARRASRTDPAIALGRD